MSFREHSGWIMCCSSQFFAILLMISGFVMFYLASPSLSPYLKLFPECIEVRHAEDNGINFTNYDNCSMYNIPQSGIEGHLYLPTPVDACSYISPPPGGFPTNSTWIALVYDYPACPTEMVVNIRNAGYTLIIASSRNDSHRTITREISDTLFPIVVVDENYTDYLKENALSFSTNNSIVVSVDSLYGAAILTAFACGVLCSGSLLLCAGLCVCCMTCIGRSEHNCCKWGIERHLQKIKNDTSVVNMDGLDLNDQELEAMDEHFRISLLHYACLNGWNDVVKDLVEKYSCDPNVKIYQCKRIFDIFAKVCASINVCSLEYLENIKRVWAGEQEVIQSLAVNDGAAIHCACKGGHLNIVKFLLEQGCDPESRNIAGATPLHFACWEGHLDIVRLLVEKGCDSACTTAGLTPLHLACWKGHLHIVKFLVEKGLYSAGMKKAAHKLPPLHFACQKGKLDVVKLLILEQGIDPACRDCKGYTPLHVACQYGCLDVVKFLVKGQHCDHLQPATKKSSVTPLDLANSHNHFSVSSFLASPGVSRQARIEYVSRSSFSPAFKVFIMGNTGVGKSTLVKAIENRLTNTKFFGSFTDRFKRVSGVKLLTAGIIPISIDSKGLGNIIMYDLAGQHEYYSSHAALLEKLVAYPGSLLMIVVDLSKDKDKIIRQLQYWNSFIDSHCSPSGRKPDVVIVGSHADVVKSQVENPKEKSTDILKTVSSSLRMPQEIIPLDCRQLVSGGLNEVCDVIGNYCGQFRQEVSTDISLNFLHSFLCQDFKGVTACRVSEIVSKISMEEWDAETVSQYLTTISDKSQFLYLRSDQDVNDSWVILDQGVLLSEVNGTVFAPKNFKKRHDISSSTGIVPFSRIEESFPKHDAEMIVSFMSHLEFCHQVVESEAALVLGDSEQQFEKQLYFFPALVGEDRPKESCRSINQTHYKCGWILQCIRFNQFFSVRFLHVLLLRLAFSFALAHEEDRPCPVLQRRCNVWKAGIHWQNRDGVEAIVEVVEQNTIVTVMMGCLEGSEVACVRLRSEVIRTILDVKEKLIELKEIFIHPESLSYPLTSLQLLSSFKITELAAAIADNKQVVTNKQGQYQIMSGIHELLYFEPYTYFNPTLLAELFKDENLGKEVPDRFFVDAGKIARSKVHILREILCHNFDELKDTYDKVLSSSFIDPMDHCYLLFRTWARCFPNPTYQALRSALDKFSVFCGRSPLNPLVPVSPQSSMLGTADLTTNDITTRLRDEDIADNLSASTILHMSDKPRLQELQCLRCRGGRRVRVIEGVAARWEHLAHALRFDSSVIEIVRRNSFHQTEDACSDVLRRWLEGQGETRQPVNWTTLIESLLDCGFVRIAEDLREAVKTSSLAKPIPAKKSHDQPSELEDFSIIPNQTKPMPTRKPRGQENTIETIIDLSTIPDGSLIKHKPTRESHDQQETTEGHSTIPHSTDRPRLGELHCLQGRGGRRVKVIEGVAAEWEELAKTLHFESSVIEHVRDTEDACRDVLRRWLEGEGGTRQPVNWATLIDSLIEAGFVDIATDLQETVEDHPIEVVCVP